MITSYVVRSYSPWRHALCALAPWRHAFCCSRALTGQQREHVQRVRQACLRDGEGHRRQVRLPQVLLQVHALPKILDVSTPPALPSIFDVSTPSAQLQILDVHVRTLPVLTPMLNGKYPASTASDTWRKYLVSTAAGSRCNAKCPASTAAITSCSGSYFEYICAHVRTFYLWRYIMLVLLWYVGTVALVHVHPPGTRTSYFQHRNNILSHRCWVLPHARCYLLVHVYVQCHVQSYIITV